MVTLEKLFNRNLKIFVEDESFMGVKKEVMEILSKFKRKSKQEEEFFEAVYNWALHRAIAAVEASNSESNLQKSIKTELNGVLPNVQFSEMRLDFILSFIDKCFLFTAPEMYKILLDSQKRVTQEEKFFKALYELAEKEVMNKRETSDTESVNLAEAVKTELSTILPKIKFHKMSEKFLTEFVAAKGILTLDDGLHAHDICVQIRNSDNILTGTFKDDFKIFDRIQKWEYGLTKIKHNNQSKQRFTKLKCQIPTTPSTVSKMKGAEWFLCLEKDGVVTVKFHSMITATDYLITELKPENNVQFEIDLTRFTYLTATRNKVC